MQFVMDVLGAEMPNYCLLDAYDRNVDTALTAAAESASKL